MVVRSRSSSRDGSTSSARPRGLSLAVFQRSLASRDRQHFSPSHCWVATRVRGNQRTHEPRAICLRHPLPRVALCNECIRSRLFESTSCNGGEQQHSVVGQRHAVQQHNHNHDNHHDQQPERFARRPPRQHMRRTRRQKRVHSHRTLQPSHPWSKRMCLHGRRRWRHRLGVLRTTISHRGTAVPARTRCINLSLFLQASRASQSPAMQHSVPFSWNESSLALDGRSLMQQHKFVTFARSLALLSTAATGCTATMAQSLHQPSAKPSAIDADAQLEKRRLPSVPPRTNPTPAFCSNDIFTGRRTTCNAGDRCVLGNASNPGGSCSCSPQGSWTCQTQATTTRCPANAQTANATCTLGNHCSVTDYFQTGDCWCLPTTTSRTPRWACRTQSKARPHRVMGPLPPPDLAA